MCVYAFVCEERLLAIERLPVGIALSRIRNVRARRQASCRWSEGTIGRCARTALLPVLSDLQREARSWRRIPSGAEAFFFLVLSRQVTPFCTFALVHFPEPRAGAGIGHQQNLNPLPRLSPVTPSGQARVALLVRPQDSTGGISGSHCKYLT